MPVTIFSWWIKTVCKSRIPDETVEMILEQLILIWVFSYFHNYPQKWYVDSVFLYDYLHMFVCMYIHMSEYFTNPTSMIRSLTQTVINKLQHSLPLGTVTCIASRRKIEGSVTICQQLIPFAPYKLKLPLHLGKWFYEPGWNIEELVCPKGITMEEIPSKLKQWWLKFMCVKQSLNSPVWQKFSHIFCRDKKVKHVASYIISKKVYSHTWHKWRSMNLIKHKYKIGQTTITSFISVKLEI
jgi:hypothetical protein